MDQRRAAESLNAAQKLVTIPSAAPIPRARSARPNLGAAYRITGPLALLALAMRKGITVDGYADAHAHDLLVAGPGAAHQRHRIVVARTDHPRRAAHRPIRARRPAAAVLALRHPGIARLLDRLAVHVHDVSTGPSGLIEGQAGVALTLHTLTTTGATRPCVAGGVGLNCSANGRLVALRGVDELFVQPAAGDAGCAIGAALAVEFRCGDLALPG